ncbi:hypothetical protein AMTR_s00093p00064650 [Amborella trichopoda]|uniref:Uncharacterized protein n=1 Tax=Amborella trichopoda TaxID=13333 RepID=W1NSN2_AMBTC|nr:hypothetical protein AMTR_s00093p00064650 [Amborella trichopoda]
MGKLHPKLGSKGGDHNSETFSDNSDQAKNQLMSIRGKNPHDILHREIGLIQSVLESKEKPTEALKWKMEKRERDHKRLKESWKKRHQECLHSTRLLIRLLENNRAKPSFVQVSRKPK